MSTAKTPDKGTPALAGDAGRTDATREAERTNEMIAGRRDDQAGTPVLHGGQVQPGDLAKAIARDPRMAEEAKRALTNLGYRIREPRASWENRPEGDDGTGTSSLAE